MLMKALAFLMIVSTMSFMLAQNSNFAYTSLKFEDCITLTNSEWKEEAEIDFISQECPGFGGYRVFFKGGDARTWLELQYGDTAYSFAPWDLRAVTLGIFPYVKGELAEWRYQLGAGENPQLMPYALIYRMSSSDPDYEKPDADTLIVLRLEKGVVCDIGQASNNEDARVLADNLDRGCGS